MRVGSEILGTEEKVTNSVNVLPDNEKNFAERAANNGMCLLILHFIATS